MLSQHSWKEGKLFLLVHPFDSPCLPRSYQSPDAVWQEQDIKTEGEYARLQGGACPYQYVHMNPQVNIPIPTRRCMYPLMSFVTDEDSLDIPIPMLPEWVAATRSIFPSYEEYCEGICDVMNLLETQPARFAFTARAPKLFYRGNLNCGNSL